MRSAALAVAVASLALAAGCSRTDQSYSSTHSAPPTTPSTGATSTTPPPLPATPSTPTGAGQASDTSTGTPSTPTGSSTPTDSSTPTATSPTGNAAPSEGKAQDTSANAPTDTLTKDQETAGMPKAGQVNNHSSTSMEQSRGQ
jgi:hypothetical protein